VRLGDVICLISRPTYFSPLIPLPGLSRVINSLLAYLFYFRIRSYAERGIATGILPVCRLSFPSRSGVVSKRLDISTTNYDSSSGGNDR